MLISEGISSRMVLEGMAKPTPCEPFTVAVVIPITIPLAFRSGPPELPGLIGALNWMIPEIENSPAVASCIVLPSWLMIPKVMDPDNP